MSNDMSRGSMNLVAVVLHCQDCDEEFHQKNGQALAAQHHRKTGHRVIGELVYSYEHPAGALSEINENDE